MNQQADAKPVILIIDDTPVNLGVVIDSLENRGYRLLIAQDGLEGLQRAAFVKPDLILLDVMMPGIDGFEVCRRLKSDAGTADIPVIFMTALAESEHRLTGFKVGGVDYLTKPMQMDEVIARIGTHLKLRSMQRQLQRQNEQLQKHQEELEQKVAQRTAELSASNDLLREEIEERKRVEKTMKFIAQRGWMQGGEEFLTALARYLGELLEVDYVIIDKLAKNPGFAETVAIYAKGGIVPNMQYQLEGTPCANVMDGSLCVYPYSAQQQFPHDILLVDMQVESYIGMPLWDSAGNVVGLIAVMDGKPMPDDTPVTSVLQLVATSAAAELMRRQYEQSLLKRVQLEEQLSGLATSVPGCMYTVRIDAGGHAGFPFASAGIEQLFGLRPEDIRDDAAVLRQRYHPDDLPKLLASVEESRQTLAPFRLEARIFHPVHGMRWIEMRSTPQRRQDGSTEWHGLMIDITERKQMEEKVLQRERELRGLLDHSPDPIIRYDKNCRRIYVNPAMERLTGKPAAQLMNTLPSDAQITGPAETEKIMQIIRQVLSTGQPAESELSGNTYSEQTSYYHLRYAPEFGTQGEVTGVVVMGRDMTAHRQVENLRHQRERELRTLIDNLPTVVVRYDREFRRIYANPAYLRQVGRPESEILGKPIDASWRATNMSAEQYAGMLADVLRSGKKTETLLEWCDGNGRLVSHAMKIVPEYDAGGIINSVLALGFDLSDSRQQQIIESNRQRVFEKMAHGDQLNNILEQVALYVESAKAGSYCGILLLDEQQRLQAVAAPSFPSSYRIVPPDSDNEHCLGWAAAALRGEKVVIPDMSRHPCWSLCRSFIDDSGAAACWSEPFFSASGRLLGVVTLYVNKIGAPDESDLALLLQAGHLSSIAFERKRIEQQMYHQASYDQLTDLPNRLLFGNRLREEIIKAERSGIKLALLFVDLDRFKEVNDTLGHDSGDDLLVEAAQRIRSCVRESDTVARLGGDEFVVLLTDVAKIEPQNRVAQAIVDVMDQPFRVGAHNAYVSASVGIAGYPQDADNADALIGCADQAMYAAKAMGRNCFSFFNQDMLEQSRQRLELVNELRGALEAGQLEVYYQPIVEIAGGRAVKAEALLRWRHPVLGMVPPDRFIPIAEETDLIQDIGAWVLREAAGVAKRWRVLSGGCDAAQISVNMSPRQFVKDGGVQAIIDYLREVDLDPCHLVVEITEGLLLDDGIEIHNKLELLRSAGIQLSLDDFGTGYSAMSYLKKFNIDYLKIDRSFVRDLENDPGDRAIAEAIVVMAHRLGLKVIAEGVETEGQLALLAGVGCEYVQGYLYAKPMPVAEFLDYVAGQNQPSSVR